MNQYSGNKTSTSTDIEQVKKQNQQSAAGSVKSINSSQFKAEFGSDTDVHEVKKLNQQSEENKNKNTNKFGQSGKNM